ncbi:Fe-S cluster assembly protein SufD [Arsenicicoccus piscis]|uniref:Fe-S cluster assembly protein SufD n=1 Tax=Arsenicicoccus piscis TaxID=673954 RepID=UPI001F4CB735|nr:Fe-S cluster assembly protein SufD [Arsenicicoccus piscis]MCH8628937.1 Fe-S cluster assembly protein SufD [Arsenicicoccus piscis]
MAVELKKPPVAGGVTPLATKKPGADQAHTDSGATFVPDQSRAERTRSFDLDAFPVPNGREEDWRFTPVKELADLFQPAPTEGEKYRQDVNAPAGVKTSKVPADDERLGQVGTPGDRAAAVAWNAKDQATIVKIPSGTELGEAVRVVLTASDEARINRHVLIEAGHHSKAIVALTHEGSARLTGNVEISAGDGADLTVVTIQEWDDEAVQLDQHDILVGRDARVRHIAITLGGKVVRLSTNVRYAGPGGSVECLGVYFTDAGQHQEHRLFVDHEPVHCTSNVEYRGALQGDGAHSVWVGDVLIRAAAHATDTYELNRNLVLTDGARADSVPNLEIETGEIVGAGHASATGRFDDEQLFYLQARGIPEHEARRLVVHGFFAGIINRIGLPGTQAHLMARIEKELADSIDSAFEPAAAATR